MMRLPGALVIAMAAGLGAQGAPIPDLGTRVRIESSAIVGKRATGELRGMNQGFVTVGIGTRGTTLVVPWSRISDVGMVTGRDERAGATLGALVGGGAALVMWPYEEATVGPPGPSKPRNGQMLASLALPVAGAIVGFRFGPEEWQPVIWRPTSDTVMLEGEALRLALAPRSKLLVRHRNRWVRGRLVGDVGDSLTVGSRTMAWSDIAQVNMQESRSRLRGAVLGATLGATYAIVRLVRGPFSTNPEKQQVITTSIGVGGAIGAIVGRGAWTRVPIPAR